MKAKAYSYVRFSTLDQIKGDSLRRQTEGAAKWCKANGLSLVESYRDLGVSAFKGKNAEVGALAEFLALARKGRIEKGSYLIVESLDRVSRNEILDALELFTSIIKAGIVIVTLSDGQVYDREKINANPMQLMISLTVMTRAHEESKTKAMRLSAAWDAKRKKAKEKKMTGKCVAWLKLVGDKFELIPERVEVVRRIFEMAAAGKGTFTITKTFRLEKIPTFGRARVWQASYVRKILDSRAVIGEFAPSSKRDGTRITFDAIPDYYPAIVQRETFATVQQLRKARPSYRGRSGTNVFSHLAFDKQTGRPMSYVSKGNGRWSYLISAAAIEGETEYCSWQYDEFLASFLAVCQKAALQKQAPANKENGKLAVKRMELADAEKQIARLVDFLARGTSGSVEIKLRDTELQKTELQQQIGELENEAAAKPMEVSKVDWRDNDALRDNLRATVKRIVVDAKARSFSAEFLDGRAYAFKNDGKTVTISVPSAEGL